MNDKNYETQIREIRQTNKQHLKNFAKWLESKTLSAETINKHLNNVDFYINEYLTYYDAQDVKAGSYTIDGFLGDFFIRKALWSSIPQIKATAASIKKFYAYMLEQSIVEKEDYEFLCEAIKENMDNWLSKMEAFDNPDEDESFMW